MVSFDDILQDQSRRSKTYTFDEQCYYGQAHSNTQYAGSQHDAGPIDVVDTIRGVVEPYPEVFHNEPVFCIVVCERYLRSMSHDIVIVSRGVG